MPRIMLEPHGITYDAFENVLRELIQVPDDTVLQSESVIMYLKFALDDLYKRVHLHEDPNYHVVFQTTHVKDSETGLYVLDLEKDIDIYLRSVKVATIKASELIYDIRSISYENFGLATKDDISHLKHLQDSCNDMYKKNIHWAYCNQKIYVFNGNETVHAGTQMDAVDGNPFIPLVDGSISGSSNIFEYSFDSPGGINSRSAMKYTITFSRRILSSVDLGGSGSLIDIPSQLFRLFTGISQVICYEQLNGKIDPNLSQIIQYQINDYLGVPNGNQGSNH